MTISTIEESVNTWSEWASAPSIKRYDIALLKIWIQFERFISELFILYATGGVSEEGFSPTLNLQFSNEEQLNVFLREGNRTYIEYPTQIKKLSKHIFQNDPFDIIFLDENNSSAYNQIISIRNYIAHESGESKTKIINTCFSGNARNYVEPNDFLQMKESSSRTTYFTYYTDIIKNMAKLLINPPQ
jgi:hypothetical protein